MNILKKLRINAGLKQKDVAEKIGVKACTLSLYESGERKPDIEKAFLLAEIYNEDITTIFKSLIKESSNV